MRKHISLIGLIVFSLIIQSSNVSANTTDYAPIISFDNNQGMTIESTASIGGYIEDEEKPTSIWWTLFSDSSIINSEIITDKISIINSSDNRSKWSFDIILNDEITSCTCYLEIYAQTRSGQIINKVLSFYISDGNELAPAFPVSSSQ